MMVPIYHRQYLLHSRSRQKCADGGGRLRVLPACAGAALIALAPMLAACDPVQIVEGSDTHVSIRYDGIANGFDDAKQLAQTACGRYGKTAKLRKTYYQGLGVGERFAFFDCV
jgi:hypothetical protein